jgi:hypothetical protein
MIEEVWKERQTGKPSPVHDGNGTPSKPGAAKVASG